MLCSREAQKPHVPDRRLPVERAEELRRKQKVTSDCHHRAWDLLPALPGDLVWVSDGREQGTVGDEIAPRSYEVETSSDTFRRKKRDTIHLLTDNTISNLQGQTVTIRTSK